MKSLSFELDEIEEKGRNFLFYKIMNHYRKDYVSIYVGLNLGSFVLINSSPNFIKNKDNSNNKKLLLGTFKDTAFYLNRNIDPLEIVFLTKKDIRKEKLDKIKCAVLDLK